MKFDLFNQGENEREMSGGAMFGYALVGFIALVVVVFVIFAASKLIGGKDDKANTDTQIQIEQTIEEDGGAEESVEDAEN